MSGAHRYDVAIVGAGPVGLALANLLGIRGRTVVVLERNPSTGDEPRAIAYDDDTLRTMQAIGLDETVRPALTPDLPVRYVNGRGETLVTVDSIPRPFGHSPTGTFEQPVFEQVLAKGLERFPNGDLRFQHEVRSFRQTLSGVQLKGARSNGEKFSIEAKYLVGCDGGRRSASGLAPDGSAGRAQPNALLNRSTLHSGAPPLCFLPA